MPEDEHKEPIRTMSFEDIRFDHPVVQLASDSHDSETDVLHTLFDELVHHLRELVTGERPSPEAETSPFLRFQDALMRLRVAYLLSRLYEEGPIVEALMGLQDDPDRRVRALALVSLGFGNAMWQDARVEPYLQAGQDDPDPLLRAAARLALNTIRFGAHVRANTIPDMALLQHLEQYAAQVMSGLAR